MSPSVYTPDEARDAGALQVGSYRLRTVRCAQRQTPQAINT
jgi:hypothetical protein